MAEASPSKARGTREFELADFVRLVRSEPWIAAAAVALCLLASIIASLLVKPQFESQALIDIGVPPLGEGLLIPVNDSAATSISTEMQFLRSRAILAKALDGVSDPAQLSQIEDREHDITRLGKALRLTTQGQDTRLLTLHLKAEAPGQANRLLGEIILAYTSDLERRRATLAAARVERVVNHLPASRLELERWQSELLKTRQRASRSAAGTSPEILTKRIEAIREAIHATRQEQLILDLRFTSEHPAQKAIQGKIEQLQKYFQSLSMQADALRADLSEVSHLEVLLDKATTNYAKWLETSREIGVASSSSLTAAIVIDQPSVDISQPIGISRSTFLTLGLLAGLVAAPIAAWAAKIVRSR